MKTNRTGQAFSPEHLLTRAGLELKYDNSRSLMFVVDGPTYHQAMNISQHNRQFVDKKWIDAGWQPKPVSLTLLEEDFPLAISLFDASPLRPYSQKSEDAKIYRMDFVHNFYTYVKPIHDEITKDDRIYGFYGWVKDFYFAPASDCTRWWRFQVELDGTTNQGVASCGPDLIRLEGKDLSATDLVKHLQSQS